MADQLTRSHDLAAPQEENQVVTFFLGDEEFGFDIMSVQEIIRQPNLCRIPMAPDYVEGVANLRGTVLPIIDTRTRFGMKREQDTDGTRVLVLDVDGHKTGLRVDRVRQVTRIQRGELEAPPAVIRGGATSDYLKGVAKLEGGKRIIMSLDPNAICKVEVAGFAEALTREATGARGKTEGRSLDDGADQSVLQIVSFTLGEEEFAFSMEHVREILRVERPNEVPDTPPYVLGIVTVRGNILPVIDLRILLGLQTLDAEVVANAARVREHFRGWFESAKALVQTDVARSCGFAGLERLRAWHTGFSTSSQALMEVLSQIRVAADKAQRGLQQTYAATRGARAIFDAEAAPNATEVLRLVGEFEGLVKANIAEDQRLVVVQSNGTLLALLVDRVREVLDVPRRLVDPPPRLSKGDGSEVAGVARLAEGKRLIMLLDANHLVHGGALDSLDGHGVEHDLRRAKEGIGMERRTSDSEGGTSSERQFVTFRLAEGEYGIPIEQIQEIDRTSKMTKIPKSADYVDGITNLRGEVIPVINARRRFGLPQQQVDEQTRVIILEIDGVKTGLLVDSVRQVLNQAQKDIAPPPASISGGVDRQFISGIGKADGGKRMIVLLDVARVLRE